MNTLNNSRPAILAAAVAFIGRGAKLVDPGIPLTLFGDRSTIVAVVRRRVITAVRVNIDTFAAREDA